MNCTEVPAGKFPTAIWNENAARAQDLADRMAMPGYTPTEADVEWIKGTAGNYRDAKWNHENPPQPSNPQPPDPNSVPYPGGWGNYAREHFNLALDAIQSYSVTVPADAPLNALGTFNAGCEDADKRTLYFALATRPSIFEGAEVIALAGGQIASIIFGIEGGTEYQVKRNQTYYLNVKNYDPVGGPAWLETNWPKA